MNTQAMAPVAGAATVTVNDCWNRIGLHGDRSCDKLAELIHCRNCPVYAAGARTIMQRALPADYQRDWATHFAAPQPPPAITDQSVLVFRIGCEWLGLPTRLCITVADMATAHHLPHRSSPVLTGVVSVKGKLYPCMSLAALMAVGAEEAPPSAQLKVYPRLLVMQLGSVEPTGQTGHTGKIAPPAFALPVQAVHGVHRYAMADLLPPPATANQTLHRYLTGVLNVGGLKVGCLDAELVGYQLAGALK